MHASKLMIQLTVRPSMSISILTLFLLVLHFSPVRPFHTGGTPSHSRSPRKNVCCVRSTGGDENDPPTPAPLPPPPARVDWMRLMGTSPRRIALSTLSATGIALAGNLFGITSNVLSLIPEDSVRSTGLDTYYPRGDFKRYTASHLYTFVFPREWIGDTALELQKVQRRTRPLDYSMKSPSRREPSVLPDVAFGPPGRAAGGRDVSSADTNVSVIVSDVLPGFSMRGTLGTPTEAADFLLSRMNKNITMVEARQVGDLYVIDYIVTRPSGDQLQTVSVIGFVERSNTIVTLTVVAPRAAWASNSSSKLRKIVSSFQLL